MFAHAANTPLPLLASLNVCICRIITGPDTRQAPINTAKKRVQTESEWEMTQYLQRNLSVSKKKSCFSMKFTSATRTVPHNGRNKRETGDFLVFLPAVRSGEEIKRRIPQNPLTRPHGHGCRTGPDIKPDFLQTKMKDAGSGVCRGRTSHTSPATGTTSGTSLEMKPRQQCSFRKTTLESIIYLPQLITHNSTERMLTTLARMRPTW